MPEVPVKVFVRIRPLLVQDRVESSEVCVRAVSQDQLVLGKDRSFRFDRVFPPESPQADVYRHCVAPLVSACLEGYNATVFAYGQTGSGKSHTMGSEDGQGGGARGEGRGIIPRALQEIFQHIQACPGVEFAVRVSYVEVYKEEPRDLLEGGVSGREVLIREDQQGNTVVVGCQEENVSCADDALGWLETGNAARVTGATRMNQHSSRSHAIFTVSVEQRWKVLPKEATPTAPPTKETTPTVPPTKETTSTEEAVEQCLSSKFHFVDLAGSERVGRTGNLGERFKESVHINSGLLALGNVISALGDPKRKSTHVPYRESKITRILKDSLGGNARTVMITCLSPAAANFAENLNSLKYAKRARNIRNRPIVNRDPQAHRLQEMKEEIEALRGELWRARLGSKPSTVATTVDTSVMVELSDVETHMSDLERELALSRQRCSHYHTHLLAARDQLLALRGATVPSSLGAGSEVLQRMDEWLASLADLEKALPAGTPEPPPQANQHGLSDANHSPISRRALETMEILQAELEQCHVDLETDEELFAEKVDELNSLQTNYDILLQEKERIEQMWSVAMETESQLHQEVGQLLEKLSALEGELSSRDSTIEELKGKLGERGKDEAPVPETQGRNSKMGTIEDYTDEKVVESLRLLTDKLIQAEERSEQAPMAILLALDAETDTRTQPMAKTMDLPFGQIRTINSNASRDLKSTQVVKADLYDSIDETNPRVPTPIELSPCEPELSHSGHFFREQQVWNQSRLQLKRGSDSDTRETDHMTVDHLTVGHVIRNGSSAVHGEDGASEMERLNQSAVASKREISLTEEKLSNAQDELRNLNLKIRLKEELIRELVKNSRTSKRLNETYLTKIQKLEQEATLVQRDLQRFQESLQRPQARGEGERGEDVKTVEEQKRKLAAAERKLAALQRKQKETERVIQFGKKSERRISELEGGIERLRNHQEVLKRRLKKETDRKTKLETDLQKYQHRIKSLQTKSDQQSKVLKIKTEEAAAAQRKLRRFSSRPNSQINDSESPQLVAQRVWLDAEVERMLQQKEAVEMLEKELSERERILLEREALIAERDTLEMRRVRSSQAMAREVLRLSMQIESIEGSIKSKGEELRTPKSSSSRQQNTHQEIAKLTQERDKLMQQREVLEQKMKDGTHLPQEEQRKLYELNECIEVLEATVDFKNDSITSKQLDIAQIIQSGEISSEIQDKLSHLSMSDAKALLTRYFEKVVHLRLSENQHKQAHRELEAEMAEQQQTVCRLERSLKQAQFEMEKRLVSQQKEHEQQVRFLMQQLAENNPENISPIEVESRRIEQLEAKIKYLEKDLYYYKKTSRDLKKKFRGAQMERGEATGTGSSSRDQSDAGALNLKRAHTEALKSDHKLGKVYVEDNLSRNATSSKDGTEPQDYMQSPLQSQFKDNSSKVTTRAEIYESSSIVSTAVSRPEMDLKHLKGSTSDARTSSFGTDVTGGSADVTGVTVSRRLVEGQSSPVSGRSGGTSAGIVRKSKKQLRQLSASDIAERMARQGTVQPQSMKQSSGATSLVKEHR